MRVQPVVRKFGPYFFLGLCGLVAAIGGSEAFAHLIERIWEESVKTLLSQSEV
jgi:hypothetical protein